MNKYVPLLWILGGVLFMLPSILGNDRTELVPIGIMFIIFGAVSKAKSDKPKDTEGE